MVINIYGFVLIEAKWFENSIKNKIFVLEEKLMQINCIKLLQEWVGQNISDIVVKNREFALRGSIEVIVIHLISSQVDSFYISWRRIITDLFQLPLVNKIKPATVTLSKASILILEFVFIHFGNVGPCGVDLPVLMLSTYLLFIKGRIDWRIVWIRSQSGSDAVPRWDIECWIMEMGTLWGWKYFKFGNLFNFGSRSGSWARDSRRRRRDREKGR